MGDDHHERLQAELELLQAMYPEGVTYTPKSREIRYVHAPGPGEGPAGGGVLVLRLPDGYPAGESPEVISATGPLKDDLRSAAQAAFGKLAIPPGEEALDVFILAFQDLLSSHTRAREEDGEATGTTDGESQPRPGGPAHKTVVIWLHHLLNTNKRKLALHPTSPSSPPLSGLTKPGYPGILVFSGPGEGVAAHVAELRSQRWQAFQVRYDSDDGGGEAGEVGPWRFGHGDGVAEVESMSEVVQGIVGERQREIFLSSVGVR